MRNMNIQGRRTFLNGALALAVAASLGAGALTLGGCSGTGNQAEPAQDSQQEGAAAPEGGAASATGADGGAASGSVSGSSSQTFAEVAATFDASALDLEYSKRDTDASYDAASATKVALADGGCTVDGSGAAADGAVVTISEEGTYVLSGNLSDGHVVVDAPDTAKVQVVFDGVDIACSNGPAFYVKSADKCFVTLADGSRNALADGATYAADAEDEPYGALFSKDDLTINGTGSLTVEGAYENGIVSKDDLVITGGTINVNAVNDALRGKDCVKIADGAITVTAGGDGIKSNNDSDATRGFVSIDGGTITVNAGDKGIKAEFYARIAGGKLDIVSADDAVHSNLEVLVAGGELTINAGDDGIHGETRLVVDDGTIDIQSCVEGLEAQEVIVNGGDITVEASDDALNAAVADLTSGDSTTTAAADTQMPGDPGQMGEGMPEGFGGRQMPEGAEGFDPSQMPEGGEGFDPSQTPDGAEGFGGRQMPEGADGAEAPQMPENMGDFDPTQVPEGRGGRGQMPDDGTAGDWSAEGQARDFGGKGGMGGMGGGMAQSSSDCLIQINGGTIVFNAGNDGLDSNGNVEINGGLVLGSGPSSGMDGSLDYDLSAVINGGTFILLGSVGNTTGLDQSTQPFVSAQVSGNAGDTVQLTDADGTVIASMSAGQRFTGVLASCDGMVSGQGYQVVVGSAATAVTAGTDASAAGMGAMGGGMGGKGGGMGRF